MTDELPEGPFFDMIREWNEMVRENRAKHPGLPDGFIPVSDFVWNCFRAEVAKKDQATG